MTGQHFLNKLEDNPYRKAVVYKYQLLLEDGDRHVVPMPVEAEIIHVGIQGSTICMWAIVNPLAEKEDRYFQIVGTGIQFEQAFTTRYHATVQMGAFVWHIFEQVGGF